MERIHLTWAAICFNELEDGDAEVLHAVGYPDKPSTRDIEDLKKELDTDEDFGMIGVKYSISVVPRNDKTAEYFDRIGIPEYIDPNPSEDGEEITR